MEMNPLYARQKRVVVKHPPKLHRHPISVVITGVGTDEVGEQRIDVLRYYFPSTGLIQGICVELEEMKDEDKAVMELEIASSSMDAVTRFKYQLKSGLNFIDTNIPVAPATKARATLVVNKHYDCLWMSALYQMSM